MHIAQRYELLPNRLLKTTAIELQIKWPICRQRLLFSHGQGSKKERPSDNCNTYAEILSGEETLISCEGLEATSFVII